MNPGLNPGTEAAFYALVSQGWTPDMYRGMYQIHTGKCGACDGHGWRPSPEGKKDCDTCHNTGRVLQLG